MISDVVTLLLFKFYKNFKCKEYTCEPNLDVKFNNVLTLGNLFKYSVACVDF